MSKINLIEESNKLFDNEQKNIFFNEYLDSLSPKLKFFLHPRLVS